MPRFSRISWKRRDDAEPPSSASSSEAVKRRRSERAMPGAPTHTWYCSVFFRRKRMLGRGGRTSGVRSRGPRGRRLALLALGLLEPRDELVVLEVARRGDDDVPGAVHRLVVARQRATADRRDHVRGADHRPTERMVAEDRLAHQVVHELVRRVLVHRDLLEHDLALRVEVGEERRVDHVAHHVERLLEVVVGDAHVDDACARARSPRSARRRGRRRSPRCPAPSTERVPLKSRCSRKCVIPALARRLVT